MGVITCVQREQVCAKREVISDVRHAFSRITEQRKFTVTADFTEV
jgi:hypothetical protein